MYVIVVKVPELRCSDMLKVLVL